MIFITPSRRLATALVGGAMAAAIVAPGAAAGSGYRDLRSPDARDAASHASDTQDLRSPDARDAAEGYEPASELRPVLAAPSASSEPSGVNWVSAALGAAGGTGLLIALMAFRSTRALVDRRHANPR